MNLPARINFVTLACRDMERMARFYRQFGWPEAPASEPDHVVFQCSNGVVLGLYGAHNYEQSVGVVADGFRGFTLAVNCEDMQAVELVYSTVSDFDDVHELEPPRRAQWGGGFSFRDPEGNIWDVAWADGSSFDEKGGILFSLMRCLHCMKASTPDAPDSGIPRLSSSSNPRFLLIA